MDNHLIHDNKVYVKIAMPAIRLITVVLAAFLLCACGAIDSPDTRTPAPGEASHPGEASPTAPRRLGRDSEYVILDGSTANIPMGAAIMRKYYGMSTEQAEDSVEFHRTSQSYHYLIEGKSDLLLVNIADRETAAYIVESGAELEYYPIRRDALCFIANESNPVDGLTDAQIRDIFRGETTNWSGVGGQDKPIITILRNETSGSQALMHELVMKELPLIKVPEKYICNEMDTLVDTLASYNADGNAIGYCTYYFASTMYAKPGLKFLDVDGTPATNDTISSGAYPYINEYLAVIHADEPEGGAVRELLKWLLSEDGKAMILELGYVPVD
jgi:phosphate transport system substrate-binding protein